MILFAILAIQTQTLRRAVIYMGIFSLISSFCYLIYSAADVAIAEAIIGSTLATILYLVALQKYKEFTIYYTSENYSIIDDNYIYKGGEGIINLIEQFCVAKELEPQVIYTIESVEYIKNSHQYDLIVRQKDNNTIIYGNKQNYLLDALQEYICDKGNEDINFIIYKVEEGE
jgi:uncharacterized MnhB-related membrane protein